MSPTRYRTIFVSDIHLGTAGCQADALLDFLRAHRSDRLYLVGDIVDLWAIARRPHFPQTHLSVIRKLLSRAEKGTEIIYLPGNHDEAIRELLPLEAFGNIRVADEWMHVTADGRRVLVLHGDRFDQVVKYARWLAWLGDIGYQLLLRANGVVNALRRRFGFGHWSLSAYAKRKVKMAVNFIGGYEEAVVRSVRERGADAVVCGHIHHPEVKDLHGVLYCNTGDWVESLTAVVEHMDGRLELVRWAAHAAARASKPRRAEEPEAVTA